MKYLNAIAVVLALTIAVVSVLVVELPKLIGPAVVIFLMVIISRAVFFYTR